MFGTRLKKLKLKIKSIQGILCVLAVHVKKDKIKKEFHSKWGSVRFEALTIELNIEGEKFQANPFLVQALYNM